MDVTQIWQFLNTAYLLVDVYEVFASCDVGMLGKTFDITMS